MLKRDGSARRRSASRWLIAATAILSTVAVLHALWPPPDGNAPLGGAEIDAVVGEAEVPVEPADQRRETTPSSSAAAGRILRSGSGLDALPVEMVTGTQAVATVRAGETAVVEFVVPRRALVRGTVFADGRPVAGAVVWHRSAEGILCWTCSGWRLEPSAETVTTGADGRFEQSLPYGEDLAFWAVAPDGGRSPEVRASLSSGTRFEVDLFVPSAKRRP